MRQHTINLYKFNELSSDAQQRAIERVQSWPDLFGWCDEWRESLKAFCDHFGVTLKDFEVSTCSHSYADTDAENSHFRGLRLSQCDRDYTPTGFCGDCGFFMAFYDEFKRTGSALKAFNLAVDAGVAAWVRDWEDACSDEQVREFIEANEYEFTENGEFHG